MADDKKPDSKFSFPGRFLVFLFAALVVLLFIQSVTSDKFAKVSFSHQVEHLINLDLTVPNENHKVAQNENLVTFSGQFRESTTEDGTARYRYLQLLETSHELTSHQEQLSSEL